MSLVIPEIVSLHIEEAASLIERRGVVLDAPQVRLKDIQRAFDDRIAAHLDALAVVGELAGEFCEAALANPSAGVIFTAAVRALEEKRLDRLDKLFALMGAIPETPMGLMSAVGWVKRDRLQGLATALLSSPEPLKRAIGIAACSMHRVDPGLASGRWLADEDPSTRAGALRLVGEIGCEAAAPACTAALDDAEPECRFWAAWSCVLLGNRGAALEALTNAGFTQGPHRHAAFLLALQTMSLSQAHRLLQQLARDPTDRRWLVEGSGVSGNPVYLPWLLKQMRETALARLAGEAFSLITGVNLVAAQLDAKTPAGVATVPGGDPSILKVNDMDFDDANLDGKRPERVETAPNDDPNDPNVDMDSDEDLPWPDIEKVEKWWTSNSSRFQEGTRYFMGNPVAREHCVDVLKNGYQRQRILAAHYLCLLEPRTPLFNTSAPAWRQQRLLAAM
jgi:uncharacterized protein (TIGR02270 family)